MRAMSVSVIIKWGGQEYSISSLSEEDTVMDLKQSIKSLTGVLPERQKLLGLKVKGEGVSIITCPRGHDRICGTIFIQSKHKLGINVSFLVVVVL